MVRALKCFYCAPDGRGGGGEGGVEGEDCHDDGGGKQRRGWRACFLPVLWVCGDEGGGSEGVEWSRRRLRGLRAARMELQFPMLLKKLQPESQGRVEDPWTRQTYLCRVWVGRGIRGGNDGGYYYMREAENR